MLLLIIVIGLITIIHGLNSLLKSGLYHFEEGDPLNVLLLKKNHVCVNIKSDNKPVFKAFTVILSPILSSFLPQPPSVLPPPPAPISQFCFFLIIVRSIFSGLTLPYTNQKGEERKRTRTEKQPLFNLQEDTKKGLQFLKKFNSFCC